MISRDSIQDLCEAAEKANFKEAQPEMLRLDIWKKEELHKPSRLPENMAAVYIFEWEFDYLKVGKVNARSNPRYQFQHYRPDSCRSNLAKSLLASLDFHERIAAHEIGKWIKDHTTRYNILIPEELGKDFVHFAEAFFILKCRPRFEDSRK